jgi:hypothetical protein
MGITLTQRSLNGTNFILHLAAFRFKSLGVWRVVKFQVEETASRFEGQRQTHTTQYAVFSSVKEAVLRLGGGNHHTVKD